MKQFIWRHPEGPADWFHQPATPHEASHLLEKHTPPMVYVGKRVSFFLYFPQISVPGCSSIPVPQKQIAFLPVPQGGLPTCSFSFPPSLPMLSLFLPLFIQKGWASQCPRCRGKTQAGAGVRPLTLLWSGAHYGGGEIFLDPHHALSLLQLCWDIPCHTVPWHTSEYQNGYPGCIQTSIHQSLVQGGAFHLSVDPD